MRGSALALAVTAAIGLTVPAVAWAGGRHGKNQIVLTGSVDVPRGKTVHTVVIVDGPATIGGHVTGDVVAVSGSVTVSGRVDGTVATVSKRARLLRGAHVGHDVLYGDKRPVVAAGATVDGKVRHEGWGKATSTFAWALGIFVWLAVTASALVLGVLVVALAPRVVEAAWAATESGRWRVIAMGACLLIGLPIVALAAAATIVGLPFALVLFLALLPVFALGYVTSAWLLGRRLLSGRRDRFVPFLVGIAILRVLALVPFLGVLVGIAATAVGLGALGVAAWRAGGAGPAPATAAPPATS